MTKKQLKEFETILTEQYESLLNRSKSRTNSQFTIEKDEIKEEIDHASIEIAQSVEINLLGREKELFDKITIALEKVKNGEFGICEDCNEEIEINRLKARPITSLCISCKESQEKEKKAFG